MQCTDSSIAPPEFKWEDIFRHLTLAYHQDLCIAIALLCPVYHIPHLTFVRMIWNSSISLCAHLLWVWY